MINHLSYKIVNEGRILLLDKPVGTTPFECIKIVKKENKYKDVKLGYAGRLDPMASGLLLLLVGDENKMKLNYEKLPKEYEVEVLFGVATDSLDLLGFVGEVMSVDESFSITQKTLEEYEGSNTMEYPSYSAKRVDGKPLYFYAKTNRLDNINLPTRQVQIHKITLLESRRMPKEEVLYKVREIIPRINGDFRQEAIVDRWNEILDCHQSPETFYLAKLVVGCEAGTYMRWLAGSIGNSRGIPSIAYSIRRLKVGEHIIDDLYT